MFVQEAAGKGDLDLVREGEVETTLQEALTDGFATGVSETPLREPGEPNRTGPGISGMTRDGRDWTRDREEQQWEETIKGQHEAGGRATAMLSQVTTPDDKEGNGASARPSRHRASLPWSEVFRKLR